MKKKVLLGFGACALALGGVAALIGGRQALEADATGSGQFTVYFAGVETWGLSANDIHFALVNSAGNWVDAVATTAATYDKTIADFKYTFTAESSATFYCWFKQGSDNWHPYINDSYDTQASNINLPGLGLAAGKDYVLTLTGTHRVNGNDKWFDYSFNELKTAYFVDGSSWGVKDQGPKAHMYKSDLSIQTTWPGKSMFKTDVTASVKVGDGDSYWDIAVYKVAATRGEERIIFNNNNNGEQTSGGDAALSITDGGVYFFNVSDKYADAIKLAINISNAMRAATYKGTAFAKSICGITDAEISSFNTAYNSLVLNGDSDIVYSAQHNGITTYTGENLDGTGIVRISDIMDVLNSSPRNPANVTYSVSSDDKTVFVITIVASSAVALGGLALLRKRKAE